MCIKNWKRSVFPPKLATQIRIAYMRLCLHTVVKQADECAWIRNRSPAKKWCEKNQ